MSHKEERERVAKFTGLSAIIAEREKSDSKQLAQLHRDELYYGEGKNLDSLGAKWMFEGNKLEDAPEDLRKNVFFVQGCKRACRLGQIMSSEYSRAFHDAKDGKEATPPRIDAPYAYMGYFYGYAMGKKSEKDQPAYELYKTLGAIALSCLQGYEDALSGNDFSNQYAGDTYLYIAYFIGYDNRLQKTVKTAKKK